MKSPLIILGTLLLGIGVAGFVLLSQPQAGDHGATATVKLAPEDQALHDQLVQCAAYYQIASEAIAGMNAPQMKAVGERLAQSAATAESRISALSGEQQASARIASAKQAQLASLPSASSLGPLMGRYKQPCQSLLQG
ncbi:hypothetical protein SAMN04488540_10552 [Ferrimonas sediminum]|uniref:Uncharacterized protein n=1 Tax=Ferrimonas sediminum TaxID=718193 RepID=A0A1G8R4I2_9GAMM|nr:hypothetical protein [Ferrimonas sediminum]SDJ11753.1 hypothetical protein SAMN04488540_10552 [Ferrimonas sediminum]